MDSADFLVFRGDLSMLITLQNFSSNESIVQALSLQKFQTGKKLDWIMCSNYDLWRIGLDGNGEDTSSTSSTNYLGIFLAIEMVAPLENGRNAILA